MCLPPLLSPTRLAVPRLVGGPRVEHSRLAYRSGFVPKNPSLPLLTPCTFSQSTTDNVQFAGESSMAPRRQVRQDQQHSQVLQGRHHHGGQVPVPGSSRSGASEGGAPWQTVQGLRPVQDLRVPHSGLVPNEFRRRARTSPGPLHDADTSSGGGPPSPHPPQEEQELQTSGGLSWNIS